MLAAPSTSPKFIFYDPKKRRWPKILLFLQISILTIDFIAIIAAWSVFTVPTLTKANANNILADKQETINNISNKETNIIKTTGIGPLAEIKQENNQLQIYRPETNLSKTVILTFDDGPDPKYTPQILDILKQNNVKAVFFVVGEQLFRHPQIAKQIVEDGHQIGAHTFSHTPEEMDLLAQQHKLKFEFDFTQKLIQAQTGLTTELFRIPYWGAEDSISLNSLVLLVHALDRGYTVLSSTTDSFDWQENNVQKVVEHSFKPENSQVILLHDAGGERAVTVAALDQVIKKYKEAGFQFQTADSLMNNKALMYQTPFNERMQAYLTYLLYWSKIYVPIGLNFVFQAALGIIIFSLSSLLLLSIIHTLKKSKPKKEFLPFISILVPAFNEEKTIAKTIQSLLRTDYPHFEIIVINNNSQDQTRKEAEKYLYTKKVTVIDERKQGKFYALNTGIAHCYSEIVVIVDADTQATSKSIKKLIQPFSDPKIGAVAGTIRVGNLRNIFTGLQQLEYLVGQQIDRRAYTLLNAISVVPGALGAWRKSAVLASGGYQGDTLTEDADLTIAIQKKGYKIKYVANAIALTEAPEKLGAFLKQRSRWTLGMMQVMYKHKDICFRKRYGILGLIVFPFQLFIQFPLMILAPIVDILAIIFFFYVSSSLTAYYFAVFLLLHFTIAFIALLMAKEKHFYLLALVPLQRLAYQLIWYYILYKAILTALKGPLVPWQKLTHHGSVVLQKAEELVLPNEQLAKDMVFSQRVFRNQNVK